MQRTWAKGTAAPAARLPALRSQLCFFAAAVAVSALVGWSLDIAVMRTFAVGAQPMKFMTAVCVLVLVPVMGVGRLQVPPWARHGGLVAVVAMALLFMVERASGSDLLPYGRVPSGSGGPLSVTTSVTMMLLAAAVWVSGLPGERRALASQVLAALAFVLGLVSFTGRLYGVNGDRLFTRTVAGMAAPTSVAFMALATVIFLARPHEGVARRVVAPTAGGELVRRTLPAAMAVPLLLGRLRLQGQRADLYGTEMGLALLTISNIAVFVLLLASTARSLSRSEMRRATADEERDAAQQVLQAFMAAAPGLFYVKDQDGRYLMVNAELASVLGRLPGDVIGHRVEDLSDPSLREATGYRYTDAAVFGTGKPLMEDTRWVTPTGEERRYSVVRFPLRAPDGRVTAVGAIGTDVTERLRAEAERDRLALRLSRSERLESLGQLAGGIAHDFNNILAVVLNYAELLAADLDSDQRQDALAIERAAERGAALTRQLLAFSRREAVPVGPVDVNRTVQGIETILRRTLPDNIAIVVELGAANGVITSDEGQIEQTLMNLAVNARDAMLSGGTLTIETADVDLRADVPGASDALPSGRYVRIRVSDTGAGMSADVRDHAFEPFFTTKPKGRGTGLGLATVYGIVKQAGGEIEMDTAPGDGTAVTLWFPAADGAQEQLVATPATHRVMDVSGAEIMVVEDEAELRLTLTRILGDRGFQVQAFATAEQALSALTAGHVRAEVLLTDVILTGMSGAVLAREARRVVPGIQVLFMSGYVDNELEAMLGDDGRAEVLAKPFAADRLVGRLTELVAASRRQG